MKGLKLLFLSAVLILVWKGLSLAQTPEKCISTPTIVYFSNGVDNTEGEAWDSLEELRTSIDSSLKAQGVKFELSSLPDCGTLEFQLQLQYDNQYNPSGGVVLDVFEAALQDIVTDASQFWRVWAGTEEMPESFRQLLEEMAVAIDKTALIDPVLSNFVVKYNTALAADEDLSLCAVSHSQGNFYSNLVRANLNNSVRDRYSIVSVANPDSFVGGDGPYTTLENDLVILAIRVAKLAANLPPPLLPNMPINTSSGDLSGHKFITTYMQPGSTTQKQITDDTISCIPVEAECFLPPNPSLQDLYNECICLNPNDPACICWLDNTLPHCSGD